VRRPQLVDFRPDEEIPEPATPPAQAEGLELRDLDRALAALSPAHREVLLLIGLEELSYGEAARVLRVPVGTVMSRLSRARLRLSQLLADKNGASLKVVA